LPPDAHGSEADIQASVRLQLKVREDISTVSDMTNQLEWMRKQIEDEHKTAQSKAELLKALDTIDKKMKAVELKLVTESEMLSDDKYFPEQDKLYLTLVWLNGEIGGGGGGIGGGTGSGTTGATTGTTTGTTIDINNTLTNQQKQQQQQQQQQQLGNMQAGQQTTNPFRLSMMASPAGMNGPSFPASPPITSPMTRQSTNPFAKSIPPQVQPFSPPPDQQFQQQIQQQPTAAPLRPMATGTNPFAKNLALNAAAQRPQTSAGLMAQPTGSTNPFRQSQFVNTATGAGWQNNQQPIGGGLDNVETIPVFPRPAQQTPWGQ
jgi:hypothetical protein